MAHCGGEWGEVLGDTVIATTILDRLLHHSHVFNIRGESYRLREKQAGLFAASPTPVLTSGEESAAINRQGVGQFQYRRSWVKRTPALTFRGYRLAGAPPRSQCPNRVRVKPRGTPIVPRDA